MLELRILVATLSAIFRDRHDLVVENLLLRHQLQVSLRSRPRPPLKSTDRLFWLFARRLFPARRRHLVLVRPETVLRWHRRGWRRYWRWRSGPHLGRPRLSQDIRGLIATIASHNPLWGTECIRGELLKLGIVVSPGSIRRYRRRLQSRPPTQSWRTFLANHAPGIWAADLIVVQTLTFRTLFVLFFISHSRRQVVHFEVTAHPSAAWVWQQLIEATPWNRKPQYLIYDRDRVWRTKFDGRSTGIGIKGLRTPIRAPRGNAITERWVRTVRHECPDYQIPLSERHLRAALSEFVDYYSHDRTHRSLGLQPPFQGAKAASRVHRPTYPRRTPSRLRAGSLIGRLLPPYTPLPLSRPSLELRLRSALADVATLKNWCSEKPRLRGASNRFVVTFVFTKCGATPWESGR